MSDSLFKNVVGKCTGYCTILGCHNIKAKDGFELRGESKASFPHKQFALSVSPNETSILHNHTSLRPQALSASKHKKLPSINTNSNEFSSNTTSSEDTPTTTATIELTESKPKNNLNSSSIHFNQFEIESSNPSIPFHKPSNQLSAKTILKKSNMSTKVPSLRQQTVVNQNLSFANHRKLSMQNLDTAVTIDILNESDRFSSRQSLEPLTNRDSSASRISSRPTSVKEPLFRKLSGNLLTSKLPKQNPDNYQTCKKQNLQKTSSVISQDMLSEFDLKISELTNEASIRQEILTAISPHNHHHNHSHPENEQDLSDYDDYLKQLESEEFPQRPGRSDEISPAENTISLLDLSKAGKLDTIDETSLTDGMQLKIKKLQLNKKSEETKNNIETKPVSTLADRNKSNNSTASIRSTIRQPAKRFVHVVSKSKSPALNSESHVSVTSSTIPKEKSSVPFKRISRKPKLKTTSEINLGIKYNMPTKPRDESTESANNFNKGFNNKPVAPVPVARTLHASDAVSSTAAKALDLDLFNPTSTTAAAKTAGLKAPPKPVSGSIVSRLGSSNSLVKQASSPNRQQLDTSRIIEKGKTKPNAARVITQKDTNITELSVINKSDPVPESPSNLDKIDEQKVSKEVPNNTEPKNDVKLEINSGGIHLHDRPHSSGTNSNSKPPRIPTSSSVLLPSNLSSSSLAFAQAAALADAQKCLADAVEASKLSQTHSQTPPPPPPPPHTKPPSNNIFPNIDVNKRILSATKIINLDLDANLGSQPVIYDMFEDYPQPFSTSSDVNGINPIKKKHKKVYYKKRSVQSGGPKQSGGSAKSSVNSKSLKPNDVVVKGKLRKDLNNNRTIQEGMTSEEEAEESQNLSLSTATIKLTNNGQQEKLDTNETSIKLKSDLVKAVAEKVDLIYNKFNSLLMQQEMMIEQSGDGRSREEKTKALNEQKANFSAEMASELEKNIDFGEFGDVSSNPELIKQLQQVYLQLKQNGVGAQQKRDDVKREVVEIKKLPESLAHLERYNSSNFQSFNDNSFTILRETRPRNQPLKKSDSIRSNADIREVFSIVNSMNQENNSISKNLTNTECGLTFPPIVNKIKQANSFIHVKLLNSKSRLIPKLPDKLSDKINTLIAPIDRQDQNQDEMDLEHEENNNDDDDDDVITLTNNQDTGSFNRSLSTLQNTKDSVKEKLFRNNYSNQLDSVGNDSFNSYDDGRNYDVKYRNDGSQASMNFLNEDCNDFQYKWKRGNLIGKGAFGSVYQAMLSTGAIIAVKQIEMEESDPNKARKAYDSVREEVRILRELDHMNTVQFMGTMLEGSIVNIFMELIPGGTIEQLLKTYGPFEEDLFKNFTTQIMEGINYIHSKNVVHRDIKGKNIMLMGNGVIKLIDFGCAKRLKKNQSSNSIKQLLKSLKGTPYWMSPEVIREVGHGSKADIWSTGCTIFEMATGMPPWGELQPIAAIYAIGSGETPAPELPTKFSQEARDFVSLCLVRDPEQRPSAAQLLDHEFLKQPDDFK